MHYYYRFHLDLELGGFLMEIVFVVLYCTVSRTRNCIAMGGNSSLVDAGLKSCMEVKYNCE